MIELSWLDVAVLAVDMRSPMSEQFVKALAFHRHPQILGLAVSMENMTTSTLNFHIKRKTAEWLVQLDGFKS